MVELVQPLQEEALDDDAADADHQRRNDERRPVANAGVLQDQIGAEGAQHVLGAVAKIDDVEHAEDHGEPEAQQRIERAVDQSDEELAKKRGRRGAEDFEQGWGSSSPARVPGAAQHTPGTATDALVRGQPLASGQLPSLSGRKGSSAGIVARRLEKSTAYFQSPGAFTSNR